MMIYSLVTSCTSGISAILKRIVRGGEEDVHEDLISQLPDDILVSIIARAPTRFVVSTSILSKRWRNLYKSVSTFKLSYLDLLPRPIARLGCPLLDSDIGLTIYRLERFLSQCSKIHCFHLTCCLTESYMNPFEQCIYYLGKSSVTELTLNLACCERARFVPFSCHFLSKLPSLKNLSLSMCSLLPNSNSKCNSLQTLQLSNVTILPDSLECILSNCLGIHSLKIDSCRCPPKVCVRGPNLRLKTLIFIDCEELVEIELYASNLATFECKCDREVKFVFDHVPRLETVFISSHWKGNNMMPYVVGKLPHLKSLCFETQYKECSGVMLKERRWYVVREN